MATTAKIEKLIASKNIAKDLDEDTLAGIGEDVVGDFDIDWESCSDWRDQNEQGMKLAKQEAENKDFPWEGAANIKYPLLTTAAMQFAARAYPEMIQGKDIVKCKVIGSDPMGEKAAQGYTHINPHELSDHRRDGGMGRGAGQAVSCLANRRMLAEEVMLRPSEATKR